MVQSTDYWDYGIAAPNGAPANHQMVALVANRADNTTADTTDQDSDQPTRMVWLVSNARVYKVYEAPEADLGNMMNAMQSAFDDVEHRYVAAGQLAYGSKVMVGVGGGTINPKGGGTPHGFPAEELSGF